MVDQPTSAGLHRAFTLMSLAYDPHAAVNTSQENLESLPLEIEGAKLEAERGQLYSEIKC